MEEWLGTMCLGAVWGTPYVAKAAVELVAVRELRHAAGGERCYDDGDLAELHDEEGYWSGLVCLVDAVS